MIENIFCISLEKKKDEWDSILKNIRENGGFEDVKIFPAINGKEFELYYEDNMNIDKISKSSQKIIRENGDFMSIWALYKLKQKQERREHAQLGTWGAVGCYLSHYSIWKMAYENDWNYCLIFEDDIVFNSDFKAKIKNVIDNIPEDADAVFLDMAWSEKTEKFNNIFDKAEGQFFGLHSYIITNKGVRNLLQKIFPIEIQLDSYMSFLNVVNKNSLNFYRCYDLCRQSVHISSIQTNCVTCDINTKKLLIWNIFWGSFFFIVIGFLIYKIYRN